MSEESTQLILRELDSIRVENREQRDENREDHDKMNSGIAHTNGTVADIVKWKIQVNIALKIFGIFIAMVVVPVAVNFIIEYFNK